MGSFLEVSHLALLRFFPPPLPLFFPANVSDPFLIPALSLFYNSFKDQVGPVQLRKSRVPDLMGFPFSSICSLQPSGGRRTVGTTKSILSYFSSLAHQELVTVSYLT